MNFWVFFANYIYNVYIFFTVTYPFDLTKTRLQIQGESTAAVGNVTKTFQHRGMVAMAMGIGKTLQVPIKIEYSPSLILIAMKIGEKINRQFLFPSKMKLH